MTIVEIVDLKKISNFTPQAPYVYESNPGAYSLASFWTDTFGAPDESNPKTIIVNSFTRDFEVKYNKVDSLDACIAQEKTFFWDNTNQKLYTHFEHDKSPWTSVFEYGSFFGFSDTDMVYIDDQEYKPHILGVPSVAQEQDIVNYDKSAFMNGRVTLNNTGAVNDFFINNNVYGNSVYLYYLDDKLITSTGNATRNDLVRQGTFYIEDYNISLNSIVFDVQDPRKAQNISIPRDTFSTTDYPDIGDISGDVIPLIYGQAREAKAIITNGDLESGVVTYRVASTLTSLGTVQVDVDGLWVTKTPTVTSLSTGEFTLAEIDGRDANGKARDCKVIDPEGVSITYTSDIIKELNSEFLGVEFVSSNYDIDEWLLEEGSLSSGGIVIDSLTKMFEVFRIVQSGSIRGFRYEINPDGKRTIRIDDNNRLKSKRVSSLDILNRNDLPVSTDSKQVFAEIQVKHSKSYNSGRYLNIINNDFSSSVLEDYRQQNRLVVETILNNSTDANSRALNDARRFSVIPSILKVTLMGSDYLSLRIYDTFDIEVTSGEVNADTDIIDGRQYYGVYTGKVISINPNLPDKTNEVRIQLLSKELVSGFISNNNYGLANYGEANYG